jgi:hypothetical protein
MQTHDDRFWSWFGKAWLVCASLFVLTCAVMFLVVLRDGYHDSQQPTFTISPDTLKARPK